MTADYGKIALQQIIKTLQIDDARMQWVDGGFDWWPGRFKVSIRAHEGKSEEVCGSWKLSATTDFLKNVKISDPEIRKSIDTFSMLAPSFAWVYAPVELLERYNMENQERVWFSSSVYLREDNIQWLPNFFACMILLQPVYAEKDYEVMAQILKGSPDTSSPNDTDDEEFQDEILLVPRDIYAAIGQQANRYAGTEELITLGDKIGRSDMCFGSSNETGATFETPIGAESALIQLHTDQPHPALGQGLLATLTMPSILSQADAAESCMWNNLTQTIGWSDVPHLGTWRARERTEGQYYCAYSTFFPNALYNVNIITNAALWMLGTARYIKDAFYKEQKDMTMLEIYKKRYGDTPSGTN